jgi:hypothetical protein
MHIGTCQASVIKNHPTRPPRTRKSILRGSYLE